MDSDNSNQNSRRNSSGSSCQLLDEATGLGHLQDKMSDTELEASTTQPETNSKHVPEAGPSGASGATGGSSPAAGIDKLLQQQKNEIMYELRRMKLGDRPVTGQGHKEAVESFFDRLQDDQTGVSTYNREEHRPESVSVEVSALVERRPVSSLLQSAVFRTNLESAIRGAISTLRPASSFTSQTQPRATGGNVPAATPLTNQSLGVNDVPQQVESSLPQARSLPQPQHVQRSQLHAELRQRIGSQLRHQDRPQARPQARQSAPVQRSQVTRQPAPVQRSPVTRQFSLPEGHAPTGPSRAQQWLEHHVSQVQGPDSMNFRELLEQAQHEDLIADISELVQQQLVTSSLQGTFRGRLESLMRNHLDNTGTDGVQVQRFIQTLPAHGIPHNDFSHLGISVPIPGTGSDILDDISVISATAAVTVPHVQNVAVSRELASVKAQLQELRSMMRLSFDLQLDIQRAIRQEVAAAMSDARAVEPAGATGVTPQAASVPSCQPTRENHCLICLDNFVDSVLYQCGHMCVCHSCGLNLKSRNAHCPVCRAPIRDVIRAYKCNQE